MSPLPRVTVYVLSALLLVLVVAAPVLAHAELKSSDPKDKAVLATPPTVITLTFTEGLDQAKSSFKLSGPAGVAGTGKPIRQGGKVMTLEGLTLAPGAYAIAWTAAATDGHVERGKLSFTVAEPTPAPATPSPTPAPTEVASAAASGGPSAAPTEAPATAAATASDVPAVASPAPSADPSTVSSSAGASGTDVAIAVIGGLAIAAVGGLLIMRRSRGA